MPEPTASPTRALPSRNEFDEAAYLRLHPDVAAAITAGHVGSAWQHFTLHGFAENRAWVAQADPLTGVSRELSPADEMLFGNEEHYFDVGASALHAIESALFTAGRPAASIQRVLDLPCGHGRVLRFLKKAFPAASLTACDLNRDGVEYCAKTFGAVPVFSQVEVSAIPLHEPFDLIWCGSLLTHLSEANCRAFLQLFERVLQPGGILVFTLHGRRYENELATAPHKCGLTAAQAAPLLAQYRRSGFGYADYAEQPGYGISLTQPAYALTHFIAPSGLRLIGYHEQGWDHRQDVIALQKELR